MAFTVQDNNGSVSGANAYITVAEFKAYHDDRGGDYSAAGTDPAIERAIVRATDYLDNRFNFVGEKLRNREQATEWPRRNAYDSDRMYVNGVPQEVKDATAEYALRAIASTLNPDPSRDLTGQTIQSKSEKVGPIEESVEFVSGGVFQLPKYPAADQKLIKAGLVRRGGTVVRG